MGLIDAAEDLGGSIAERARSFGESVGSAAGFASDLASRALNTGEQIAGRVAGAAVDTGTGIVEGAEHVAGTAIDVARDVGHAVVEGGERVIGGVGQAASGFASGLVDRALGVARTGIGIVETALSDPAGFISNLVQRGRSMVSSAFQTASQTIGGIVSEVRGEITNLISSGVGAIGALVHSASQGASALANAIGDRYIALLDRAEQYRLGIILRLSGRAKRGAHNYVELWRMAILAGSEAIRQAGLVGFAYGTQALHGVARAARSAARAIANKVKAQVDGLAKTVARRARAVADGVTRVATTAQQMVNRTLGAIAPHLPGPLQALARAGQSVSASFTSQIASVASGAATLAANIAHFGAVSLDGRIEATLSLIRSQINANERLLMLRLAGMLRRSQETYLAGVRLYARLAGVEQDIESGIDTATSLAAAVSGVPAEVARAVIPHTDAGGDEAGGVGGLVGRGIRAMGEGAREVRREIGAVGSRAWDLGRQVGERVLAVGGSVVDRGIAIGQRVLDPITRFSQARQPHDGDLTGPFFPGNPMAEESHVPGMHGQGSPGEREREIGGGAYIFINGIDTSLAEHYRAAQRLSNALNTPVVGVYNASAGMGTDLIQCAADKFFDRSGNPAVATMTRLIRTYGDARRPHGGLHIFAHSQGSLIVSEALRQAQGSGADLRGNDITTFGNAAFTYPAGPRYHHYIHDDDAVSGSVGTGSLVSHLMNDTWLGRTLSQRFLGPTADVDATTTVLHHGGSGIEPHSINAPDGHDYIGDLPAFRAQEERHARAGAPAVPVYRRTGMATGLALARAGGSAAASGVESRYGSLDSRIRSLPSIPGLPPNSLWGAADRGLRTAGRGIMGLGSSLAGYYDSYFSGLSVAEGQAGLPRAIQRKGIGSLPQADPDELNQRLLAEGGPGNAPSSEIRSRLSGYVGADPGDARIHTGPHAAAAARNLNAEAFTIGRDVYFGQGKYDPASRAGLSLLGHELTHVVQQTSGRTRGTQGFTRAGGDSLEREAQRTGELILADTGHRDGLFVRSSHCVYSSDQPVSRSHQQRLEEIARMALQEAESRMPHRDDHRVLEHLDVRVDLDLERMSDAQAASVWATSIVQEIGRRVGEAHLDTPAPIHATAPLAQILRQEATAPTPVAALPGEDILSMYPEGITVIYYRKYTSNEKTLSFANYSDADVAEKDDFKLYQAIAKKEKVDAHFPNYKQVAAAARQKGSFTADFNLNDKEFPMSAQMHAPLLGSIGFKGTDLGFGVANEMSSWTDVTSSIQKITGKLKELYTTDAFKAKYPNLKDPWKVNDLVIYTHGWGTGLGTGAGNWGGDLKSGEVLGQFVNAVKDDMTSDVNVALMACSTAEEPKGTAKQGEGTFADEMRDKLYDAGLKGATVMGHTVLGNASNNPNIRMFGGPDSTGTAGGGDLFFNSIFPDIPGMWTAATASNKTFGASDQAAYASGLQGWYAGYFGKWNMKQLDAGGSSKIYYTFGVAAMMEPKLAAGAMRQAFSAAKSFSDFSFEPHLDLHQLGVLRSINANLQAKDNESVFKMLNGRSMTDMLNLAVSMQLEGTLATLQADLGTAEKSLGKASRDRMEAAMLAVTRSTLTKAEVEALVADSTQVDQIMAFVDAKGKAKSGTPPIARSAMYGEEADGGAGELEAESVERQIQDAVSPTPTRRVMRAGLGIQRKPAQAGLSAQLTGIFGKASTTGSAVVGGPDGSDVLLTAPGVSYVGNAMLKKGVQLGTDSIQVGFIQTAQSWRRTGVYRKDGDPTGDVTEERRFAGGPARDERVAGGEPFYEPPSALTDAARWVTALAEDQPKAKFPSELSGGKLTQTSGIDSFLASLAAKRGSEIMHLQNFAWDVPWDMTLDSGQSGTGGTVTVRSSAVAPTVLTGDPANVQGIDPKNIIDAYPTEAAAAMALRSNRLQFFQDLERHKVQAPDSYWNMVGALWHSALSMVAKVTVQQTDSRFGSDSVSVVLRGASTMTRSLSLNDGMSGEATFLGHMAYDPSALGPSTTVTVAVAGHDMTWKFPFGARSESFSVGSRGQYSVDLYLQ